MKKILCLFISLLLMSGCSKSVKPLNNNISISDFSRNAVVEIGGSSYDCLVEYIEGAVTVTALSSSVAGLSFSYNGSQLTLNYKDMCETFDGVGYDIANPAVELYNIFKIISSNDLSAVPAENGFNVSGETASGIFTAVFNKDYTLNSIDLKQSDIYVKFKALS